MLIRKKDHLGIRFREDQAFKWEITRKHLDPSSYPPDTTLEWAQTRQKLLARWFLDKDYTDYILTKSVQEIAATIKVTDSFNYKLLDAVKEQHSSYLLDETRFFRFIMEDYDLKVFYLEWRVLNQEGDGYLQYESFRINTLAGELHGVSERAKDLARELIRYIIFVNLGEVEYRFLGPKKKVGTRKNGAMNTTDHPVTIVNADWNKIVVRTESFGVKGHLRLQACGERHRERKLVWIKDFKRKGYTRKPKHLTD